MLWALLAFNSSNASQSSAPCCTTEKKGDDAFGSMVRDAIRATDAVTCSDFKIGESQLVKRSATESATGIPQAYILERTGSKQYKIKLNLSFDDDNATKYQNRSAAPDPNRMRERVKRCYRHAEGKLRAPDGNAVNFELIEEPAQRKASESISISIGVLSATARSHSRAYAIDGDCMTFLHEALHLTGLVDEYTEPNISFWSKTGLSYDCRSKAATPSIMAETHFFSRRFDLKNKFIFISYSFIRDPDRGNFMGGLGGGNITPKPVTDKIIRLPEEITEGGIEKYVRSFLARERIGPWQPDPSSLIIRELDDWKGATLHPAHFRFMAHPGCIELNKTYTTCAKHAYITSTYAVFGAIQKSCPAKPPECEGDQWLQ